MFKVQGPRTAKEQTVLNNTVTDLNNKLEVIKSRISEEEERMK